MAVSFRLVYFDECLAMLRYEKSAGKPQNERNEKIKSKKKGKLIK